MKYDDNNRGNGEEQLELGPEDSWPSRDNPFTDLEDSGEFEEPDRDSDHASVYTEFEEEEPDLPASASERQAVSAGEDPGPTAWEKTEDEPDEPWEDEVSAKFDPGEQDLEDTWAAISSLAAEEAASEQTEPVFEAEGDDDWEEDGYEEATREFSLPVGMVVVGIVALVLLGVGGYGVMQDRAALQEQIRQLQGSLATAASPEEVARVRNDSETLSTRNRELEQQVDELSRENRSLQSIIGGLESQLQAQQEAMSKAVTPAPPAKPAPAPAPEKPAPQAAAKTPAPEPAPATAGNWFVNFGSYSQRETAESWSRRLDPGAGRVIVSIGEKDGRTFYRVRVIDLPDKEIATTTARALEQEYGLSRLWIGQAR